MQEMSNPDQRPTPKGPGEFLGNARRKLGMEPENVAQMLRLSAQQIIAIEADDFDSLPEPTYVRGYLRSYSQLLNVDPEEVIRTYNQAIGGWKTATYSGLATEKQATSNDSIVRFATMGVIGLVLGLAVVWWLGQEDTVESVPAPTEVAVAPTDVAEPEVKLDLPAPELAPAAPAETSAVPVAPVAPVAKEVTKEKAVPPAVEEKPVEPAVTKAPTVAPVTPKQETIAAPKPMPSPPPEINIPAGTRARLVLRTQGTTWADIRDANDNKLLYESVAAGREIAIEGESPIKVFLGNADAVSLEFNGADYNFSAYKQGKWARFTLGQAHKSPRVEDEEQ
jgi:cytoskeleton protein RodZ